MALDLSNSASLQSRLAAIIDSINITEANKAALLASLKATGLVETATLASTIASKPPTDTEGGEDLETIITALLTAETGSRIVVLADGASKTAGRRIGPFDANGNVTTEAAIPTLSTPQQVWNFTKGIVPEDVRLQAEEVQALAETSAGAVTFDGHAGFNQAVTVTATTTLTLANIHPGRDYHITWSGQFDAVLPAETVTTLDEPESWVPAGAGKSITVRIRNTGTLAAPSYRFAEVERDA